MSSVNEPGGVNVLLVGLGRWGEEHLRALGEFGVTIWAADTSPERLAWTVRHGIAPRRAVADYRAALDGVGIGMPPASPTRSCG